MQALLLEGRVARELGVEFSRFKTGHLTYTLGTKGKLEMSDPTTEKVLPPVDDRPDVVTSYMKVCTLVMKELESLPADQREDFLDLLSGEIEILLMKETAK